VRQRRDCGEQLGLDVLAGDEQLDRLDPGCTCCVDEILALDGKSPSSSRLRFCARSLRTSFSVGFDAEVIKALTRP
jgi:hypothetical protein